MDVSITKGFYCGHGNCLKNATKDKKIARTMSEWMMFDLISHDCCVPIEETEEQKKLLHEGKFCFFLFRNIVDIYKF